MFATSGVRQACFAKNVRLPKYGTAGGGGGGGVPRSRQGDTCADFMSTQQKQLPINKIKGLTGMIPVKISHLSYESSLNLTQTILINTTNTIPSIATVESSKF